MFNHSNLGKERQGNIMAGDHLKNAAGNTGNKTEEQLAAAQAEKIGRKAAKKFAAEQAEKMEAAARKATVKQAKKAIKDANKKAYKKASFLGKAGILVEGFVTEHPFIAIAGAVTVGAIGANMLSGSSVSMSSPGPQAPKYAE